MRNLLKKLWKEKDNEAGYTLLDVLGALFVGLLVISVTTRLMNTSFSNSKLSETEQNLIALRMQVRQVFSGSSNYNALDNALAIDSGLVPNVFIDDSVGRLGNTWGGTITLGPAEDNAAFFIEFTGIPQAECVKLALFQTESWLSVAVNGNNLGNGSVKDAANACTTSNSIRFVTR